MTESGDATTQAPARGRSRGLAAAGLAVGIIVLGLVFSRSDLHDLASRAASVRWAWAGVAGVLAVASYAAIGVCEGELMALLGHPVPQVLMLRATMVAVTVNRSFRSAGMSGFATLSWLLSGVPVPSSVVLAATVAFSLLTNALFALMFVAGIVLALASAPGIPPGKEHAVALGFALAAVGFGLTLGGGLLALGWDRLRRRWIGLVSSLAGSAGARVGRPAWGHHVGSFLDRFSAGGREIAGRMRARDLLVAVALASLRIALSVMTLGACLHAASVSVAPSVLLLAYTAGKVAGSLSIIPGGLGLVEGSMASVLEAFGVPREAALLVALLNRVTYHFFPAVVGLAVFGPPPPRPSPAVPAP